MCTDQISFNLADKMLKLAYKLVDLGHYKVSFNEDYSEYSIRANTPFKMWNMSPNWEGILRINQDKITLTVFTSSFFKNSPFKELQYDISKLGYTLSLEHSIPSRGRLLMSSEYVWLEIYEVYDDIS